MRNGRSLSKKAAARVAGVLSPLLIGAILVSCSPPADPSPKDDGKGIRIETDLAYGTDSPLQTLDIWSPSSPVAGRGMVVYIHGGSWVSGDKFEGGGMIPQSLSGLGYVTASVNYRLADPGAGEPSTVGFTEMLEDLGAARAYLSENASRWGCDPNRIALVGVSAGGHLALLESLRNNGDGQISACASLSGPADLTDEDFLDNPAGLPDSEATVGEGLAAILGSAYDSADEGIRAAWEAFSPQQIVEALENGSPVLARVRWLFAWGEKDALVPGATQRTLAGTITARGGSVTELASPEDGHDLSLLSVFVLPVSLSALFASTLD